TKEKVLAAYMRAMAIRMCNLLQRVGCEKELVVTGGQSKNVGIISRIEHILGMKTVPMPNWEKDGRDPMAAGAIGAALFAKALYERNRKS
ncbi:MAG: BadF/BadG/BcrA/BcrD ATPase family protein, partial [Candidatus Bathyarchaeia archaeon]